MSHFNKLSAATDTKNLAGGNAYSMTAKEELVHAVTTTFLDNKYYENGSDRQKRIIELIKKVDPVFVGKLAIYARNTLHLRSVTHLLTAELSLNHKGDSLVSTVLDRISERPDDLLEVAAYLNAKLPKQIKKGIRHALYRFTPYQLAKYRGEGKKVKLVDLFNLTHPKAKHYQHDPAAWTALLNGELKNTETWESKLSAGVDKRKAWTDLLSENKLGYMAALRNCRNIAEVCNDDAIDMLCALLTNKEAVLKSKQLPFRFYNAYENNTKQKILNAISDAMDISVSNIPDLPGRTLIGVDTSRSMSGDPIRKASILAAALSKKNDNDILLYDTQIQHFKYLQSEPVLTIAQRIQRMAKGGGTCTSLVLQEAQKKKYDRIIILSDNESWIESSYWYGNGNCNKEYDKIPNKPLVYAVDIQGYGTKDIDNKKVKHIPGFSERIFDFIGINERDIIKEIESIVL